ncbi:alpha/beta hydrolase family protein [Kordia jejudonensis]|uniref:alpha/beta hydrolase family protein n=1 Tax=Kordia jejudonensis TaxID=1348245 RepID=UPI000629A7BD|nr:prolyl oligopeptidase family serine peptidase [Kordia jejudonensis]
MKHTIPFLLCCFLVGISFAQKKAITHDDYDLWKNINNVKVSENGKLIVSTIETVTKRGDGYLEIYNTETKQKVTYFNGVSSNISQDEKFVIFQKPATYAEKRTEKKQKTKDENKAKDVLYIYDAVNNLLYDSIHRVKKYSLPKKNSEYIVIEKFKSKKDTIKGDSLSAWKNNYALVYHLKTKQQDTIFDIKSFILPEEGTTFYYTTKNKKSKKKAKGIFAYNVALKSKKVIDTSLFDYKKLSVNKQGNQLAYLADRDSAKTDSVPLKLFVYRKNNIVPLVENEELRLGKMQTLSAKSGPRFSENGKRLYFYSKIKSLYKKDTTLLAEEIPDVDVWNWNDKITQPRQKALEDSLEEETRLYYYDLENGKYVRVQDDVIDNVIMNDKYSNKYALGIDDTPYKLETWLARSRKDYYVIDLETGNKRLLFKKTITRLDMTNDGKHAVYFDYDTKNWMSVNLKTLKKHNLTKGINVAFDDEDHDTPSTPHFYGNSGLDKNGNILLNDKYDIWSVPVDGSKKAKNITKIGRKQKITFRTLRFDTENYWNAGYVDNKLFLVGFDEKVKADGIYFLANGKLIEKIKPTKNIISNIQKAKSKDIVVYQKESFKEYEDLYLTTDNFKTDKKITDVNPHQKNFKWGTSELVTWNAYDGTKLEGIVYKPENFDPSKKYPMIVYFYERNSDGLNHYTVPKPSASTVNKSYLVSNDYLVFVPDIVYKTGQPGKDAYNCVISGVEAMEKKGYVDSSRMALQGQSWGGYQVAYLVTKTNKFKAAMAGAPVSNMTSAYGGIRWGSGMSRMFQYEKTQSRIGKTLWEGFDNYIESSPLFSLPNVQTPLLIMHNDNDGAVPYYQGIELFMGMRRLRKPAWMLVYNNEAHNLRKMKNKQDLSIRMMQFFDYYLKDAPAPIWMTKGVPRSEKGINFGYDLEKGKP